MNLNINSKKKKGKRRAYDLSRHRARGLAAAGGGWRWVGFLRDAIYPIPPTSQQHEREASKGAEDYYLLRRRAAYKLGPSPIAKHRYSQISSSTKVSSL